MAGTAKSGRKTLSDDKIQQFKGIAWSLIIDRCTRKNDEEREKWVDKYTTMFSGRMMPQQIEGTGDNGAIVVELRGEQYGSIVRRENNKIIAGTTGDDKDGSA